MWNRLLFLLQRLDERLWLRPLLFCVLSVAAALVAKSADGLRLDVKIPGIASESIETLLSITAGSMLVIATLAVASMVSAYASASSTATPRSFTLLVADDLSQNALSTFMGAFIFTFVALVALKNGYYGHTGLFVLFLMTVGVVALVIVTFVRWVDWIARLGRIGTTVRKVESTGAQSIRQLRQNPRRGGAPESPKSRAGTPVYADDIGYVQHINVESLQACATENDLQIRVSALPGTFVAPNRALAIVDSATATVTGQTLRRLVAAFEVGDSRLFDSDPRFALIALSEIASRALSPSVNDPGTAIGIFGSFVRLFAILAEPQEERDISGTTYDRVMIPEISVDDMLDDAFRAIARDGAAIVEVQLRLQKALHSIASMENGSLARAAKRQSRMALKRAEAAIDLSEDMEKISDAASWSRDA